MTLQMKGDFALEGHKYTAKHGNTIEVRQYQPGNLCWRKKEPKIKVYTMRTFPEKT
jgi:hypothetical protein